MFAKELQELGLSASEAAIYGYLLVQGDATASEISRAVHVGRTNVYEYMASLKDKGLVNEFEKRKKSIFHAESPENLRDQVQKKLDAARSSESVYQNLLPKLSELYLQSSGMPSLKHYIGEKGYREISNIMYLQGNDRELFMCLHDLGRYEPAEPRYRSAIQNRGLFLYLLVNKGEAVADFAKRDQRENRKTAVTEIQFREDLAVYEDKVIFGSLARADFKVSVLQSFPLADLLRELFRKYLT